MMDGVEREQPILDERASSQALQRVEAILRDSNRFFPFEVAAAAKLFFPDNPTVQAIRVSEEDLKRCDDDISDYTNKALIELDIVRASSWAATKAILVEEGLEEDSPSNRLADSIVRVYGGKPPSTPVGLLPVERLAIFTNFAIFAPPRTSELGLTDEYWGTWVSIYRRALQDTDPKFTSREKIIEAILTTGAALRLLFPEKGQLEVPQGFVNEVGNLIDLYSKPDESGFYMNDLKLAQTLRDFKLLSSGFTGRVEH